MINFSCSCGRALIAEDQYAGQSVACPQCGQNAQIPGQAGGIQPPSRSQPGTRRRDDEYEEDYRPRGKRRSDEPQTSSMAFTSMIMGILFCVPAAPLVAIGLGIGGLASTASGAKKGRGYAITGLVLGVLMLGAQIFGSYYFLILGVQRVRDAAVRTQSMNNLKQIGLAAHSYSDSNQGKVPPAAITSKDGTPLLSWRVAILPYIGEGNLYNQFHLDEPWDSPHNRPLAKLMPITYVHPMFPEEQKQGLTRYQLFVGRDAVVQTSQPIYRMSSIPDGLTNTILAIETPQGVPWTKPEDIPYSSNGPLPKLGLPYMSPGFCALLVDGSVRFIPTPVADQDLRAAIEPADGKSTGSLFNR